MITDKEGHEMAEQIRKLENRVALLEQSQQYLLSHIGKTLANDIQNPNSALSRAFAQFISSQRTRP